MMKLYQMFQVKEKRSGGFCSGWSRGASVGLGLAFFIWSAPLMALEDKIVARVDGTPIYEWEIALAEREIGEELAQVGAKQRRGILVRYVVDTRLMALAGAKAGLEKEPAFRHRIKYNRVRALRDTYFEKKISASITDKELREVYDREVKKIKPVPEIKARHILLKKEEDALDVIERLNRGADFEALAREKSIGPSGRNGGDLGYFSKGQMAKNFEEAAFALKVGDISPPVQSSFGWHVIKVEGKRMTPIPTFEDLKDRIKSQLVQIKSRKTIEALRKTAKIELLDK